MLSDVNSSELVDKNSSGHYPSMMFDKHNCELFDQVHPISWVDPDPDLVSDMFLICNRDLMICW